MSEYTQAIYAGTFDPCTLGHFAMIKKAAPLFDKLYIVIAENPNKKSIMFPIEKRLEMLEDMARIVLVYHNTFSFKDKIEVCVLPPYQYLASFAKERNCKFLVRGIRDQMDFAFEQNLYRTNKQIENNVETIYLMPDDAHSLISSSWVKNLMGCNSWTKVIENSVTPLVLDELKKWYLKSKLHEVLESPAFKHYVLEGQEDYIWDEICKQYERKPYHNLDHLISFLEGLKPFQNDHKLAHKYPIMVYSAFMHDIDPDENKSAEIACSYLRMMSQSLNSESVKDTITRLIMATKHTDTRFSNNEDEQIMASIDLMVLAGNEKDYAKYARDVYSEYFQASNMKGIDFAKVWIDQRGKFLEAMLAKPYIIPLKSLRDRIEDKVQENLKMELHHLNMAKNITPMETD